MKLIINNIYTSIEGASAEAIQVVRAETTIRINYYYKKERRYRDVEYFQVETQQFPTGVVPRVYKALKVNGFQVTFEDKRVLSVGEKVDISLKLPPLPVSDADYSFQEEAVKDAVTAGRGLMFYPTGAGKTVIIARIIDHMKLRSLIVVPNLLLLNQTYEKFQQYFGTQNIAKLGESEHLNEGAAITIATQQTLWALLKNKRSDFDKIAQSADLLFIDECHHVATGSINYFDKKAQCWKQKENSNNTWYDVVMQLPSYYRFGMSATLDNPDSSNDQFVLEAATGRIISAISVSELIERKVLCPAHVTMYTMKHPKYSEWRNVYRWEKVGDELVRGALRIPGAYENNIVENNYRNLFVADLTNRAVAEGKRVLVFVDLVESQGKTLANMIDGAVFLHGACNKKEREEGLKRVREQRKPLIGTIFKEGFDFPAIDTLIIANAGKSHKKIVQQIGRVLRVSPGKTHATIIDIFDDDKSFCKGQSKTRLEIYKSEQQYKVEVKDADEYDWYNREKKETHLGATV